MSELCKRCHFFPVHRAQGYYAAFGLCLRALMRDEDCRRCVPPKYRRDERGASAPPETANSPRTKGTE